MSTIPTRQHHVKSDLLREVRKADPDWDRDNRKTIAYRVSNGRTFEETTDVTGPYGDNGGIGMDSSQDTFDSTHRTMDRS